MKYNLINNITKIALGVSLPFMVIAAPMEQNKKISYSIGVKSAEEFSHLELDLDEYLAGYKDFVQKQTLKLTAQEIEESIKLFQRIQKEKNETLAKEVSHIPAENSQAVTNLTAAENFLKDNAQKPNIKTLVDGIQYSVTQEGTGEKPALNDTVVVNYIGKFIDGTEFDNSYKQNKSISFKLDPEGLIKGWIEVLPQMTTGSKWTIYLHPKYAYGEKGIHDVIAPNSLLIFEIELVSFNK